MNASLHVDSSRAYGRWQAGWTIKFGKRERVAMRGAKAIDAPRFNPVLAELTGIHAAASELINLGTIYPKAKSITVLQIVTDCKPAWEHLVNAKESQVPAVAAKVKEIRDLLEYRYRRYYFLWVPRKQNRKADAISREAV